MRIKNGTYWGSLNVFETANSTAGWAKLLTRYLQSKSRISRALY